MSNLDIFSTTHELTFPSTNHGRLHWNTVGSVNATFNNINRQANLNFNDGAVSTDLLSASGKVYFETILFSTDGHKGIEAGLLVTNDTGSITLLHLYLYQPNAGGPGDFSVFSDIFGTINIESPAFMTDYSKTIKILLDYHLRTVSLWIDSTLIVASTPYGSAFPDLKIQFTTINVDSVVAGTAQAELFGSADNISEPNTVSWDEATLITPVPYLLNGDGGYVLQGDGSRILIGQ